jgi:hypothetical protein
MTPAGYLFLAMVEIWLDAAARFEDGLKAVQSDRG